MRGWALKPKAKPKYVVSTSRHDFPWNNTFRIEGDLREAVTAAKQDDPILVAAERALTQPC